MQITIPTAVGQTIVFCRLSAGEPSAPLIARDIRCSVALAVSAPSIGLAGLLRFAYPDSSANPALAGENPCLFADTGIPELLSRVRAHGVADRDLRLYACGAAALAERTQAEVRQDRSLAVPALSAPPHVQQLTEPRPLGSGLPDCRDELRQGAKWAKANELALKKILWREHLCLAGEDLGGDCARSLWIDASGRIIIRSEKQRAPAAAQGLRHAV